MARCERFRSVLLHDGQRFLIEEYAVATTLPAVSLTSPQAAPVERVLLGGLTKSVQGFAGLPSVDEEMRMVSSMFPTMSMKDESLSTRHRTFTTVDCRLFRRTSCNPRGVQLRL